MSTTAQVTLAEYDAIVLRGDLEDRRVELIRGEICETSPIGAAHERAVDMLTALTVGVRLGYTSTTRKQVSAQARG